MYFRNNIIIEKLIYIEHIYSKRHRYLKMHPQGRRLLSLLAEKYLEVGWDMGVDKVQSQDQK